MAPDGKMFHTVARKGELFELRQALNANTAKDRKNALKRVVAAMTLGRDMSSLFPDVVKNTVGDLSMKKLVYLYIINYANVNADLSILIVNTFIKDSSDPNPLIRALAIRTMALVPIDKITEYLCTPLRSALQDPDPYVRKTAAVCVAKLYDTNPTLAVEDGFIAQLQGLLSDSNASTVANAVAALSEIAHASQTPSLLPLNAETVPRFLAALSECSEWGQIFLLETLADYVPQGAAEADEIAERIIPRLQHANSAVVLAAIRVLVTVMPRLDSDEKRSFVVNKMSAPLVTLLTGKPELQFVTLRNVALVIRSYPTVLSGDVRVLFASYADPLYVKREKLDLLVQIADESNCEALVLEFLEYAGEVDVTFAKKAVDSIGRVALQVPSYAPRCVAVLGDLLSRKVQHLTEQIAIAVRDICRAYPKQYPTIVEKLCESVEDVDDPNAKSALVWLIGEYVHELPTAVEMLEVIATNIADELAQIQLQMLSACVKALLVCGARAQAVMNAVLNFAKEESGSVDVRDRAFMYSQLVEAGPEVARMVVLGEKPAVSHLIGDIDDKLHRELLGCMSSIASVYHKPPMLFEGKKKKAPVGMPAGEGMAEEDLLGLDGDDDDVDEGGIGGQGEKGDAAQRSSPVGVSLVDDLLGGSPSSHNPSGHEGGGAKMGGADDLLAELGVGTLAITDGSSGSDFNMVSSRKELLSGSDGKGLQIRGTVAKGQRGGFVLRFDLRNEGGVEDMSGFAFQLNKNLFGFQVTSPMVVPEPIRKGSTKTVDVAVEATGEVDVQKGLILQMAIKFHPGGVVYFANDVGDQVEDLLDKEAGGLAKDVYLSTWAGVADSSEVSKEFEVTAGMVSQLERLSQKLREVGIFTVAKRSNAVPRVMYLSAKFVGSCPDVILAELSIPVNASIGGDVTAMIASRCTLAGNVGAAVLSAFNDVCMRLLRR